MSANLHTEFQSVLLDLTRQHSAAQQRQRDLEQQLKTTQDEIARLGFMQLGRKMMLRAELDNINKKLAANKQLQVSLRSRIDDAQARLDAALAEPAPVEESAPVEDIAPAKEPAPAQEPAPAARPVPAASPARPGAPRKPRAAGPKKAAPRAAKLDSSADLPLQEQITRLLAHLEGYYPERKFFSGEVLTAEVRARLAEVTASSGHASVADFLAANGWQQITPVEGRALRRESVPAPGQECDAIRPKLISVMNRLEKHYPDKIITRSIQHDHKGLAQDVSALSAYLGYASAGEMLSAYGFRYDVRAGGRPALDADAVIAALQSAYADAPKPRTISQIAAEHPEYAAMLKTLQNQAPKRFGMSLKQYFAQQGLL